LKSAHKVHLWGLYVTPNHRRQGIASELLDAVLCHASDLRAYPGSILKSAPPRLVHSACTSEPDSACGAQNRREHVTKVRRLSIITWLVPGAGRQLINRCSQSQRTEGLFSKRLGRSFKDYQPDQVRVLSIMASAAVVPTCAKDVVVPRLAVNSRTTMFPLAARAAVICIKVACVPSAAGPLASGSGSRR
jgi:hypothetical protein